MTINLTDTAPRIQYSVGGTSTTGFEVPFVFFDDSDLLVYDGVTLKTLTTDYTVTGGDGATGTVTLNTGVTNTTITIVRDIPVKRTSGFPLTGPFNITALNTEQAKIVAMIQQLEDDVGRAVAIPDTDGDLDMTLPVAASRASMFFAFDGNGEPVMAAGTSADLTPVSTFINTLLDDATAADARTTLDAQQDLDVPTQAVAEAGTATDEYVWTPERIKQAIAALAPLPRSYLAGMGMTIDTDTDHDISFAAGACRDAANAVNITNSSAMVKRLDATWSAGTAAGGLSSSLSAPANSTWYHCFAILVGGSVDFGFDTSLTAANLVADHSATAYRRVGSILTNGSANIVAFTQTGDHFEWDDPPLDVDSATLTATSQTLSVPLGVSVLAIMNAGLFDSSAAIPRVYVSSPNANDEADSESAAPLSSTINETTGGGVTNAGTGGQIIVRTNTSSQVRTRSGSGSGSIRIATLGWLDDREKQG